MARTFVCEGVADRSTILKLVYNVIVKDVSAVLVCDKSRAATIGKSSTRFVVTRVIHAPLPARGKVLGD
jgi:hypothetical protein